MTQEVTRSPHPGPQTKFLSRPEREILYGGARGGGKTAGGQAFLSRWIDNPKYRALVLRHTFADLKDWRDSAMDIYVHLGGKVVGDDIIFPSGAKIITGYLKDNKSYEKYKGHEYQKILIEELTQIPSEELYVKLMGSNRSTVEGIKPQMISTTNPDGVGRLRVKRRFIDLADEGVTYRDEQGLSRMYIPAKVTDNPSLMKNDPDYIKYLEGIKDDQLRKARLDGDWDAYDIKGSIYAAQIKQLRSEQRICAVPYDPGLRVNTHWDLGVSDATTIIFRQQYGKEIRIIDDYYNEGEGLQFYAQILRDKKYDYDRHYAPHDITVRELSTGKSRLDQALEYGIRFDVVPMIGIWDGINKARQVFAHCYFDSKNTKTLVEHLEIYRKERDEKHQVFRNKPYHGPESHFADAFRYLAVSVDLNPSRQVDVITCEY